MRGWELREGKIKPRMSEREREKGVGVAKM